MNEPVKLGLMPPLTGIVSLYGQEITWAAQIACMEINERGGVLGRPLEIVIEDDGSLPETAVPAALKLVQDHKCSAIIGNLLSNSRIAVANRVTEPLKVPYLNFSFYEGGIRGKYFFSFSALPNQQIDKMIPYMAELFGPKFFFAGNNYEWPHGSIDAAKRSLVSFGGEVVGEEYFDIGTDDFHALLEDVARSGADVFVPYAAGADQFNLLTQFTEHGLKDRMAVVMGHYDEAMAQLLPPHVREGFFSSNTYFMSIDNEANHRYLKRLADLPDVTGICPHGNGVLTNFGEGTYLCVHAFAKAANLARSLEADDLAQALKTIQIDGPQGPVIMDPNTHHAHVNTYLSRCDELGYFHIEQSFGLIAPDTPERYRQDNREGSIEESEFDNTNIVKLNQLPGNPVAILITDADFVITSCNAYSHILFDKKNVRDMIGETLQEFFSGYLPFDNVIQKLNQFGHWHGQITITKNSKSVPIKVMIERTDQPNSDGLIVTCKVSHQRPSRDTADSKILDMADIAILAINEKGIIIQANKSAGRVFEYPQQELIGLALNNLIPPHLRQRHNKHIKHFMKSPESEREMGVRGEITGYRKNGTFFPAEASISKFSGVNGTTLVATIRDISKRKRQEEALVWRATHDALTGLPNRSLILERLDNSLKRADRNQGCVALMFIDVDEFKLINDHHGHGYGDEFLKEISKRFLFSVRPGDTVARFGGDEFMVLCDDVQNLSDVGELAEKLIAVAKQPVMIDNEEFFPSVSIGIALGYDSSTSADELMRNADVAMYDVKSKGRDGWRLFNTSIRQMSERHLKIANGLRQAVEKNELRVFFQPIVDARQHHIIGAEALVRWTHNGEFISPAEFIPVAESSGVIGQIGKWVFEQSCQNLKQWQDITGVNAPYVSVNLSGRQLNSITLADEFIDIMRHTGVTSQNVVLEVTETTLMTNVVTASETLNKFGQHGLGLSIDDFGTGYSSLSRITDLPVTILKVDRAFITDIEENDSHRTITGAIIDMAHRLNLKVTAEGVETTGQLNALQAMGCELIQGYYFYKPMPAQDFLALIKTQCLAQDEAQTHPRSSA